MSRSDLNAMIDNAVKTGATGLNEQAKASMALYLRSAMQQESSANPDANRNNNKRAKGLFQFMPDTWRDNGGGDIWSPQDQCRNVVTLTLKARAMLHDVLDREPNAGEYYLAHFLGNSGAKGVLQADPNKRIYIPGDPEHSLVSKGAIDGNPITFRGKKFADFTAGDLRAWAESKMKVDISARLQYQETPTHTPEEEAAEARTRYDILSDAGVDQDLLKNMMKDGGILGLMFFAVLAKVFGNMGEIDGLDRVQAPEVTTRPVTPPPAPAPAAPAAPIAPAAGSALATMGSTIASNVSGVPIPSSLTTTVATVTSNSGPGTTPPKVAAVRPQPLLG